MSKIGSLAFKNHLILAVVIARNENLHMIGFG